ncbi:MAG TPA: GNAT family N-acetyltransferase [Chitinophagaceae bacterium]|nr:GNAT family N-acetyltransferase [Chitinophagaceae bacterium]
MSITGFYGAEKEKYSISTDPSLLNVDVIFNYLSLESYWAKGIPREVVEKSIAHSLCFGLYYEQQQIGFARLVTDEATFAYLADVFVLEAHRGKGLSKWLMEIIHAHPGLQGLRRWVLGTRDAHALYEKFGWAVFDEDLRKRFMQKHNNDLYSS